jgi:hypothetical protein
MGSFEYIFLFLKVETILKLQYLYQKTMLHLYLKFVLTSLLQKASSQ